MRPTQNIVVFRHHKPVMGLMEKDMAIKHSEKEMLQNLAE
jgi:hypothetical protein